MDKSRSIEEIKRQAAKAIIGEPLYVHIGGDTIKMCRPTLRTLMAMSALISLLRDEEKRERSILEYAKPIGAIFATMILGKPKRMNLLHRWRFVRLKRRIEERYTPRELLDSLAEVFGKMGVEDFFVLTTSLTILNGKREVGNETTALGQ